MCSPLGAVAAGSFMIVMIGGFGMGVAVAVVSVLAEVNVQVEEARTGRTVVVPVEGGMSTETEHRRRCDHNRHEPRRVGAD